MKVNKSTKYKKPLSKEPSDQVTVLNIKYFPESDVKLHISSTIHHNLRDIHNT
jgi:hypothetical protein